jgi:hypothetical protein
MRRTTDKPMKHRNSRPRTTLAKKVAGSKPAVVQIDLRTGKRAPPWIAWPIVWLLVGGASPVAFEGVVHFRSTATSAHHAAEP